MNSAEHVGPGDGVLAVSSHDLRKRFGRQVALAGVELRVPEGAVYALVGPNGAGKSTTLRMLMNLERPDGGVAEVLGMDAGRHGPEVRARTGYAPEGQERPWGWMSVRRLLRIAAAYRPSWDEAYAARLSAAFSLRLEARVRTLSKGEMRRLQLVLAMAHRPPLLLLDEPTDGLDPVVRKRALALLAEHLASTPTTLVVSTHQIHEVETLADHLGVMREGRLTSQMSRDEMRRIVRRYRLEVPQGWRPPEQLQGSDLRRSSGGREARWDVAGEESEVGARLTASGARVMEVEPLSFEEAALVLLSGEVS
jgi:ABC-2 type transport system ATP-binding protein